MEVIYFHGPQRCKTRVELEKVVKETVTNQFSKQIKNGKVSFKSIDVSTSNGEKIAELVKELGIEANVVKEEDLMKIMSYNVLSLPALVIDEKVVARGPHNRKELEKLLEEYKNK